MKRILAIVDFADPTESVAHAAAELAAALGAAVVLLHVSTPDADYEGDELRDNCSRDGIAAELRRARRKLQRLADWTASQGVPVRPLLARSPSARGNPRPKIRDEVRRLRPDLIVTGAVRAGLIRRFFGGSTVSDTLLRAMPCPILVVPQARSTEPAITDPHATRSRSPAR